jgi:predicted MPP superfamily phosphohydrolase
MTETTSRPIVEPPIRESAAVRFTHRIEAVLDTLLRPAGWAAALSYRVGLQGRLQVSETVIHVTLSTPRATPLRIAFASDFHAGPTTDARALRRACAAIAELQPDVLLLGGDFVSYHAADIDLIAPLLEAIDAPFGKFAVLGNHDLRSNAARIVDTLERSGIRMITNARETLAAPFDDVTICGLDDPTRGEPRPDIALDGAEGIRIVLMHSPDALATIGNRHFDLALCGHTHGGQIALPGGKPILVPGGPLNREFCHGRFDLPGDSRRTLLVSRGIGCSALPARLFAAPEVHLCLIT